MNKPAGTKRPKLVASSPPLLATAVTVVWMILVDSWCSSFLVNSSTCSAFTLVPQQQHSRLPAVTHRICESDSRRPLSSSSSSDADTTSKQEEVPQELIRRAMKLRQEATDLEQQLQGQRQQQRSSFQQERRQEPALYKEIADSIWTLTYRFSDTPAAEEDADNKKEQSGAAPRTRRDFVSGKVTVLFKSDGYTELISSSQQEDTSSSRDSQQQPPGKKEIVKAWGWDVEQSNERGDNDTEYILFPIDVKMHNDDDNVVTKKFYLQARIERNHQNGKLSLQQGTVTIKQDLVQKQPGQWGFLSPAGILAEFRHVGDFVAKPSNGE